jgi:hypothetical protein
MNKIQKAILRTLTYFNIFDYPLTIYELHKFLFFEKCSLDNVMIEVDELVHKRKIYRVGDSILLDNIPELVKRRDRGREKALKLWKVAQVVSHLMKRFPYVRGIFISGALAKLYMDRDTDIDFFIITKPERLWICRTINDCF